MSQKLIQVFTQELNELRDKNFKEHIKTMLEELPDYILNMPFSSSGKYHPADEINADGMIRHIKRCAVIADEIARMKKCNDNIRDILIAGAILHDIFMQDKNNEFQYTIEKHPIYIYDFIKNYIDTYDIIKNTERNLINLIINKKNESSDDSSMIDKLNFLSIACLLHEGKWTIPESYERLPKDISKESKQIAFLMHIIDYIASRRFIFNIMNPEYYNEHLKQFINIL